MKILERITLVLFAAALLLYGGSKLYRHLYVDDDAPILTCQSDVVEIGRGEAADALLKGVTAHDAHDGDLTDQVMIQGVTQLIGDDTAKVTYVVFDAANNMATCTRTVRYTDYEKPHFVLRRALVYPMGGPVTLLDRLQAVDVVDGNISGKIRITSQNVVAKEVGTYSVTAQVTNSLGDTETVTLKLVISPDGQTELALSEYIVYLDRGADFDPDDYIATPEVWQVTAEHMVNTDVPGTYYVCYTYGDDMVYQTVVVK